MWIVLPVLVGSDEPVKLHPKPKTYRHEEADLRQRLHAWHAEGLVVTEVTLDQGQRLPDRQFYVLQSDPVFAGDEIALEVLNAFDNAKTVPLPDGTEFTGQVEVKAKPEIEPVETLDSKVDWLVRMVGELLEKSGRDSTNVRLAAAQQNISRASDDDLMDMLEVREAESSGTSTENFIKSLMRLQSVVSPSSEPRPADDDEPKPFRTQDIEIHQAEPEEPGGPRPMDVPDLDIPDPEDFDDIDLGI
jgi:hypothetical protein